MQLDINRIGTEEFQSTYETLHNKYNIGFLAVKVVISRTKIGDVRFIKDNKFVSELLLNTKDSTGYQVTESELTNLVNILVKYIYLLNDYSEVPESEKELIPEEVFNFFRPLIIDL